MRCLGKGIVFEKAEWVQIMESLKEFKPFSTEYKKTLNIVGERHYLICSSGKSPVAIRKIKWVKDEGREN